MFSASERAAMKSATAPSHASMLRTRSVLVRKRGSSIISGLPMARNTRSAIACIDAEIAMNRPSAVRIDVARRGGQRRLPVRCGFSPVTR